MRRDLLPYFGLPFYRAMLERSGFEADIAGYDAAAGDPAAMGAAISDDFLRDAHRRRRRGRRARRHPALPRRGRDVAVRRPDLEDRHRRDAARRRPGGLTMTRDRPRPPRDAAASASSTTSPGVHPRSRELYERARESLIGGVPMPWMMRWAGGHPVFAAHGAGRADRRRRRPRVHRLRARRHRRDGRATRPPPTANATAHQAGHGITMMLPTEEAIWVGEELTRRFGVPRWLFTLSATDANRTALRLARQLTRPAEGPRLQLLLPRLRRRGVRRRGARRDRRPRGQRRRAGRRRRDHGRDRVQRRRRARAGARDAARSPSSSPSRR